MLVQRHLRGDGLGHRDKSHSIPGSRQSPLVGASVAWATSCSQNKRFCMKEYLQRQRDPGNMEIDILQLRNRLLMD